MADKSPNPCALESCDTYDVAPPGRHRPATVRLSRANSEILNQTVPESWRCRHWHAAHQIDDQDMKAFMIDVVDRYYDFLTELCATWTARRRERSFHRIAISSLMGLMSST
jgi:hypothetical protein